MNTNTPEFNEVAKMVRQYYINIPDEYLKSVNELEICLRAKQDPIFLTRGGVTDNVLKIRNAILKEIRLFLCTDDPKYKDLREMEKILSTSFVMMVSKLIFSEFPIPENIAIGLVAMICEKVLKVGKDSFCSSFSS